MTTLGFAREMRGRPTPPERALWRAIRARQIGGLRFRRQVPFGRYIVDFFCPEARLVIERDGATHVGLAAYIVRDESRSAQGLHVMRFWNNDVMANLPGILDAIAAHAPSRPSPARGEGAGNLASPSPLAGEGRGGG